MLYVIGSSEENEVLLYHALLALRDSLNILLKYGSLSLQIYLQADSETRNSVDKRTIYEVSAGCHDTGIRTEYNLTIVQNYDLVSLAIDEIIDDGERASFDVLNPTHA